MADDQNEAEPIHGDFRHKAIVGSLEHTPPTLMLVRHCTTTKPIHRARKKKSARI
jgi:hypothetical protein